MMLAMPIQHLAAFDLREANLALARWGHRMGACNRPNADVWAHGVFLHGDLIALSVTATTIKPGGTCGLDRTQAIELARLCAAVPWANRVMLRLWREAIMPAYGRPWAVNYQDEALHSGNTYRLDGWVRLGRTRSGTDTRSGKRGRNKTVWGWHSDPVQRRQRACTASSPPCIQLSEAAD